MEARFLGKKAPLPKGCCYALSENTQPTRCVAVHTLAAVHEPGRKYNAVKSLLCWEAGRASAHEPMH
eukprot:CAMPEP_0179320592 /NCGR_PEP_ID=MMETSP0797-20121207/58134_1 /TAXON_ID=47934 /ORGANISM="Dinophysis acuminata, Strain DAEP01" /LENGTH=66 /DNA_ID=CAMNT_0021032107 /DNA_START=64 /DNA_END=261 /DNA_ORIENTATION=+